jgi:site-specific DNA-methyltransferase (adenine-specific)
VNEAPLARLEQATRWLAEARSLGDFLSIREIAEAARAYARAAQLGIEAQNHAVAIQLTAERKAGEILAEMPMQRGGRPAEKTDSKSELVSAPPRLRDIGITPKQSMEWQQVARIPEPEFERELAATNAEGKRVNRQRMLKVARTYRPAPTPEPIQPVPDFLPCAIEQADAASLPLPDGVAHLIVTSPPYGLGVAYSNSDDDQGYAPYMEAVATWCAEMYRVATPQGRLCLNIPLDITRGGVQPIYADWLYSLRAVGWKYRTSIVWNEGNINKSTARGSVDSPSAPHVIAPVEMILVVHKGEWNLGRVDHHDLTHEHWLEWTNGLWTFSGERRSDHPAPFPEELPRRCIELFSFRNDTVLDPFVGSGTSALAAHKLGRTFFGFDQSPEYVQHARARLAREVAA